jgi:carboxylesterase
MPDVPNTHPNPTQLHADESGPVRPGCEPGHWQGTNSHGVLVLHGFTGSPDSMRPLAQAFANAGFTVSMPRLPGHGTTVADMHQTSWADWSNAAIAAYDELNGQVDRVVVAGLSMGGTLTAHVAANRSDVAGIVLINAAVAPADEATISGLRSAVEGGMDEMPAIGGSIRKEGIVELSYDAVPMRPLLSLMEAGATLNEQLPQITCPAIVMVAPEDPVVNPAASDHFCSVTGGPVERVTLPNSLHVATLDNDAPVIEAAAVAFATRVCS